MPLSRALSSGDRAGWNLTRMLESFKRYSPVLTYPPAFCPFAQKSEQADGRIGIPNQFFELSSHTQKGTTMQPKRIIISEKSFSGSNEQPIA